MQTRAGQIVPQQCEVIDVSHQHLAHIRGVGLCRHGWVTWW